MVLEQDGEDGEGGVDFVVEGICSVFSLVFSFFFRCSLLSIAHPLFICSLTLLHFSPPPPPLLAFTI